jgi:hypothetical protein
MASIRGALARIAGLRWAEIGAWDLAILGAGVLTVWNAVPQLGIDFWGVPFGVAWLVATAGVGGALLIARRYTRSSQAAPERAGRLRDVEWILLIGIVVSWILYDFHFWQQTNHLYDLNVYLGSASRWLDGGHPYVTAPLTEWPFTAREDYFLYPPPLLPFFGLLSRLPEAPVAIGWTAAMIACSYKACRLLGLPRRWSVLLLAFPPAVIGFESGNVAGLTFLLFAAGARAGGALVADGLFKVQTGLPALWLIRERRWRGILTGVAVVVAVVVVTLPLVGLDAWRAWLDGLNYRAASQAEVPSLYGYSYAKILPGPAYSAVCAALIGIALLIRGRPGLAALGLASIFASPALWPHGFVFALPAVMMLESGGAVWLILGAGAFGPNMWLLFAAGWLAVLGTHRRPRGAMHPLTGTEGPWSRPAAPQKTRWAGPDGGS